MKAFFNTTAVEELRTLRKVKVCHLKRFHRIYSNHYSLRAKKAHYESKNKLHGWHKKVRLTFNGS